MTSPYITEAVRRAKLPISLSCDTDGEFFVYDWSTRTGYQDDDISQIRRVYIQIRNELATYQAEQLSIMEQSHEPL